jgi:hypothetical protein
LSFGIKEITELDYYKNLPYSAFYSGYPVESYRHNLETAMSTKKLSCKCPVAKEDLKAELRYAKARRREAEMARSYYSTMGLPLPTSLAEQKALLDVDVRMLDRKIKVLEGRLNRVNLKN